MTYTLLIVDDTPQNIQLIVDILAPHQYEYLIANSGEKALQLLQSQRPDLILLDVMMPGLSGFETCERLRQSPSLADIPVVFVTASHDDVSKGFAAGGNDYISKPVNPSELTARVNHQLERLTLLGDLQRLNEHLDEQVRQRTAQLVTTNRQLREEIKERRFMQDRLQYLAEHDFVTKAYNRAALDAHVSSLIDRIQRHGGEAVYLQVDLDNFRLINESCGSIAGDELLLQVSEIIAHRVKRPDFLARLGGDKFAVVLNEATAADGQIVANDISAAIKTHKFEWDSRSFGNTASIALITVDRKVESFDQLLLMADEVMYLSKKGRQDAIVCYDENTERLAAHRSTTNWALRLYDAIEHDHFQVYAQQIVPLEPSQKDRKLKLEVLCYLLDPDGNILRPEYFIPSAERFHLVSKIDRWMIHAVCEFLSKMESPTDVVDSVSINLSAISLRHEDLKSYIKAQLSHYQLPPSLITFEITETESIINVDATSEFMQDLKAIGCRFALDDFGSGYASYNYLRQLPFDFVKIDGAFVRDINTVDACRSIVCSVVEIAHTLNMEVVGEYVENSDIRTTIAELGVQWGQGYALHQPEPLQPHLIDSLLAEPQLG